MEKVLLIFTLLLSLNSCRNDKSKISKDVPCNKDSFLALNSELDKIENEILELNLVFPGTGRIISKFEIELSLYEEKVQEWKKIKSDLQGIHYVLDSLQSQSYFPCSYKVRQRVIKANQSLMEDMIDDYNSLCIYGEVFINQTNAQ